MTNKMPDNKGKTYNTHTINQRAILFKSFYTDPMSKTFCNIRGSALRAGYSEEYASNISTLKPKWWVALQEDTEVVRAEMLQKSEKNIKRVLYKTPKSKEDEKLIYSASTFVSERIGKDAYSTRKELTDKGGKRLFNKEHRKDSQNALEDLFKGVAPSPSLSIADESSESD